MDFIKNLSIPTKFEIQPFDDRFSLVKIYVMHSQLNLNGSFFSLSAIEGAKESICNIPILGFIKKVDGTNEVDFGGHEMEMTIDSDGEFKTRYLGRAIGVIPAINNDYHYETFDDKTYVVVNGYLWNDYCNEALDIMKRDGEHSQSMEITVDDAEWDESNNFYNIKKYRYTGLCVLGNDKIPAMVNAKVKLLEQQDSKFSSEYYSIVEELCAKLKNIPLKEEETLEENKEVFENQEEVVEEVQEEVVEVQEQFENVEEQVEEVQEETTEVEVEPTKEDFSLKVTSLEESLQAKENEVFEINTKLHNLNTEYSKLEEEVKELREYKSANEKEKEKEEKNKLFDKYSLGLTDDEMKPVKDEVDNLSTKELTIKLNEIFTTKNLEELSKKVVAEDKTPVMDMPKKDITKSKYAV